MTKPTARRERFGHLLGVDRYRIVVAYPDGSVITESFTEVTPGQAKASAAALIAPTGDRPCFIEIRLGQFRAVGGNDCEWCDYLTVSSVDLAGPEPSDGWPWVDRAPTDPDPVAGSQLALI